MHVRHHMQINPTPTASLTNLEDLREFLVSLWSQPGQSATVFAGAGISIPPPSNLPSAVEVIELVTSTLCNHPAIEEYRADLLQSLRNRGLKMEVLFEMAQRSAATKLPALFQVFDGHSPNHYHHFLARLLQAGSISHVVTPNFDCLIENASVMKPPVLATEDEHAQRVRPAIYKIHGTVNRPETIIGVLKQVSRGLGANKNNLMLETLSQTCVLVGWSDDDIDLTPAFFEAQDGLLIWFSYDPNLTSVVDFRATVKELPPIHPKIERLLREKAGIAVWCDPLPFFLTVWRDLEKLLGPITTPDSADTPDRSTIISTWADSLTLVERLIIVSDVLRHLTNWNEAQLLLKEAEKHAATAPERFNIHYRLGLCFTNLSLWRDAFDSFDLCLLDKGFEGTIEDLIEERPISPELAVLYGNLGSLFGKVGRTHDSVTCHEMDAFLSDHLHSENRSLAYANLAAALSNIGDLERSKAAAQKAATYGVAEGDLLSVAISHQVLANNAAITGDWNTVQAELEAALEIATILSRPDFQIECLKDLAQHCYKIGEFKRGRQYIDEALGIASYHNLTDMQAELWMIIGVSLKEAAFVARPIESFATAHELKQSFEAYEKSLEFLAVKGTNQKLKSIILNNRGLLFHLSGDRKRAYEDLWESLALRTSLLDDVGRATVLNNLALVILGSEESEEFLLEARSIYERFRHKLGLCQVMHDLAGVHMVRMSRSGKLHRLKRRSDYEKALSYLTESMRLAQELKAPAKIKQAEHNLRVLETL